MTRKDGWDKVKEIFCSDCGIFLGNLIPEGCVLEVAVCNKCHELKRINEKELLKDYEALNKIKEILIERRRS